MKNFYFVRHGQTEWNAIRKLQGIQDSPLTEEGVLQAKQLSVILPKSIQRCISSPLGRAVQTAEILSNGLCDISTNPLLAEMGFGNVEGVEKELFKERFPEEFYNLWHRADRYDPGAFNGETFLSVQDRAQRFLNSLKLVEEDSLIVSHGMILKVIFGLLWQHDLSDFWNDPVPLNTSITHVTYERGCFEIVDFSNVEHLEDTEIISYV